MRERNVVECYFSAVGMRGGVIPHRRSGQSGVPAAHTSLSVTGQRSLPTEAVFQPKPQPLRGLTERSEHQMKDQMPSAHSRGACVGHASFVAVMIAVIQGVAIVAAWIESHAHPKTT